MKTLAFILSVIATVGACIPPLLKGKNMKLILLVVCTNNALLATSYVLTGAFNGAVSCYLGAVQTFINYFFERKGKPIPKWLIGIYAAAFVLVNLLVFSKLTDIFAILAVLAFVLAICQKNGKSYRICTMFNVGLWTVYDAFSFSIGPMLSHLVEITALVTGMVLHDRKKKNT